MSPTELGLVSGFQGARGAAGAVFCGGAWWGARVSELPAPWAQKIQPATASAQNAHLRASQIISRFDAAPDFWLDLMPEPEQVQTSLGTRLFTRSEMDSPADAAAYVQVDEFGIVGSQALVAVSELVASQGIAAKWGIAELMPKDAQPHTPGQKIVFHHREGEELWGWVLVE